MSETTATLEPVRMVTALFADRANAGRGYQCATDLGYAQADINVVMSDQTRERHFADQSSALAQNAAESVDAQSKVAKELGGPTGGTLGTAAPVLAAIGTLLLVPGIGIAVAGPVAVALTAAGAVGLAGGLITALTDWGVPKDRMEEYEGGIRKGGILLGVKPKSTQDAERLVTCWEASGGRSVHS
jgi:hypothetical protein